MVWLIILHIILCTAGGLIVYSYVVFPLLLQLLTKKKIENNIVFEPVDELPQVSILMSLYNEEKIIIPKLKTLVQQEYPIQKLNIYIASDCSNDNTNILVQDFIQEQNLHHFHFYPNAIRQGKPKVINQLAQEAFSLVEKGESHIFIITDASVLLEKNVVFELVKHFKNPNIGLVDSLQVHTGMQEKGISKSEDLYISGEAKLKHYESLFNGKMMGPFGGCYAIRSHLFIPIPPKYLVDDFFLSMNVLQEGYDAINEMKAMGKESVSHSMAQEYRRKKRISAGNFQNLVHYRHLLHPKQGGIAFHFWSHKVLRWLGSFFIIIAFISNAILACEGNLFDVILFIFQVVLIIIVPILDWILEKMNIHIRILRSIRYFFMMNFALLEGFIRYIKGIKNNVWQPTQRPDSTEHHT